MLNTGSFIMLVLCIISVSAGFIYEDGMVGLGTFMVLSTSGIFIGIAHWIWKDTKEFKQAIREWFNMTPAERNRIRRRFPDNEIVKAYNQMEPE